ncbi:MAG: hypothetical protein LQ351_006717 [Letrouitia transgressa]|nr:MAG: hypothetical protein LQ351_006717 [Letrouitia transgressa]
MITAHQLQAQKLWALPQRTIGSLYLLFPESSNVGGQPSLRERREEKRRQEALSPPGRLAVLLSFLNGAYTPISHGRKLDLSQVNPRILKAKATKPVTARRNLLGFDVVRKQPPKGKLARPPKLRLLNLLASYLAFTQPRLRSVLKAFKNPAWNTVAKYESTIFSDKAHRLLDAKGYDVTDLATWAWILDGSTSDITASRLAIVHSIPNPVSIEFKPVPTYIFLLILRRTDINASALKSLVEHAWYRLRSMRSLDNLGSSSIECPKAEANSREAFTPSEVVFPSMTQPTIMTIIVRLLRHSRNVWPALGVNITEIFNEYIIGDRTFGAKTSQSREESARLSFLCNRMLSLLSLPSSSRPFQSLFHRQKAQFMVLRKMVQFDPPLIVDREGHRAVTRVFLACQKTARERKWASLKSRSWPPWKEEKLGLDADVGLDFGISRAAETMRQAVEAGYESQDWESTARILAGWDTDGSPTIQIRSLLQQLHPRYKEKPSKDVWAARVQASRTIDEAWACFLACKERGISMTPNIYRAVFEKLLARPIPKPKVPTLTISRSPYQLYDILPGDGKELCGDPVSQHEAIYVKAPPPDVEGFYRTMLLDGIRPSGRLLTLLLRYAETYHVGLKYMEESNLSDEAKRILVPFENCTCSQDHKNCLRDIPTHIFAAYITFLCRFARNGQGDSVYIRSDPFLHALRLVRCTKPFYRPTYNALLESLSRYRNIVFHDRVTYFDPLSQASSKWNLACALVRNMHSIGLECDFVGFSHLCKTLRNVHEANLSTAHQQPVSLAGLPVSDDALRVSQDLRSVEEDASNVKKKLQKGLVLIKSLFKQITTPNSITLDAVRPPLAKNTGILKQFSSTERISSVPRLLAVPEPTHLHTYIRLLGQLSDSNGILELLRWMSAYSDEIIAEGYESRNGPSMIKKTLVAARTFLENHNDNMEETIMDGTRNGQTTDEQALKQMLLEARNIVDSNESWGGWPTDDEVKLYYQRSQATS